MPPPPEQSVEPERATAQLPITIWTGLKGCVCFQKRMQGVDKGKTKHVCVKTQGEDDFLLAVLVSKAHKSGEARNWGVFMVPLGHEQAIILHSKENGYKEGGAF